MPISFRSLVGQKEEKRFNHRFTQIRRESVNTKRPDPETRQERRQNEPAGHVNAEPYTSSNPCKSVKSVVKTLLFLFTPQDRAFEYDRRLEDQQTCPLERPDRFPAHKPGSKF
jgi:hypothetical protein